MCENCGCKVEKIVIPQLCDCGCDDECISTECDCTTEDTDFLKELYNQINWE